MKSNIPNTTLLKALDLIQKTGVEIGKVIKVSKSFDPEGAWVQKWLENYVQSGQMADIDLRETSVEKIPKGLKCDHLRLTGNKTLEYLPKIEAERIWAENTNIYTIEEGLKCNVLDLHGNETLETLPIMQVKEVIASQTEIRYIANGFTCEELDLTGNHAFTNIPMGLNVDFLILEDTHFSEFYTIDKVRDEIERRGGSVQEIEFVI